MFMSKRKKFAMLVKKLQVDVFLTQNVLRQSLNKLHCVRHVSKAALCFEKTEEWDYNLK